MRLLALVLLALLAAPAGASDDALIGKGKSLYKQLCAHCHGIDMVNPGTGSFDLRRFPVDQKERFHTSVTKGKGNMPAWGDVLLPGELDAIWAYVASRGGKERLPANAAEAPAAPLRLIKSGTLTACLAANGGVMSSRRHNGGTGIDFFLVDELAKRLGLALDLVWYESEPQEESDPVREIHALLAMRVCDLVPSFALYARAVGPPPAARAAPPRFDRLPASWRRGRQIDLEPLGFSAPYLRTEIGVVLGPGFHTRAIASLGDLSRMRIGVQQGTLAGAILQMQSPAAVKAATMTLPPGPRFLWQMENGAFDAALVDVAAYDLHLRQNTVTRLRLSDYRHPFGMNIAMAMLRSEDALRRAVNAVLSALMRENAIAAFAAHNKIHYAAPRKPDVAAALTLRSLALSQ